MITRSLKIKRGKTLKHINVALPESVYEAGDMIESSYLLEAIHEGLIALAKRDVLGIKKKVRNVVKIRLNELPEDLKKALKQAGIE